VVSTKFAKLGEQKFAERTDTDGDGELVAATDGFQVIEALSFDNFDNSNLAVLTVKSGGASGTKMWEMHIDKSAGAGQTTHSHIEFPNGLHSKKGENIYISVATSTDWDIHTVYYDNQ
jgi:hypothetical protein